MPDNLRAAALRHRIDADLLANLSRFDNAGQLIGYAAECAIKLAFHSQMKEIIDGHFPDLCWRVKKRLQGRNLT